MDKLETLLVALEQATDSLARRSAEDYDELAPVMRRRSEAVLALCRYLESAEAPRGEKLRRRLQQQRKAGLQLLHQFRLRRSTIRTELAGLIEEERMLSAFSRQQPNGGLLDYTG